MKSDLDQLMAQRGIDALIILPGENEDPYRTYLSNGARHSGAVVKRQGHAPVLIVNGMEIDEAAKSGLPTHSYEDFGYGQLAAEHKTDRDGLSRAFYGRVFDELGVQGQVAFYGVADVNHAYHVISLLARSFDTIRVITEPARATIFDVAYETKDSDEVARLKDVARRTSAVMRATRDWIATHRAQDGLVVTADGSPLTIGDVKRKVRGELFAQDLEDPEGMIFAQGRDAAIPHSRGEADQPLRVGQTIVFDLFPREPGGYFHDMTRTWCIGYAPEEVQAAYDDVMEAYERSVEMCKPGMPTNALQKAVCEYFEAQGHPTVLNSPGTSSGYVHSLAHGLGLNVHEAPYFPTHFEQYRLQPGNVFTIEPGLYYPERGYGIRVEDTVYLNAEGALVTLTECPTDLVIELRG